MAFYTVTLAKLLVLLASFGIVGCIHSESDELTAHGKAQVTRNELKTIPGKFIPMRSIDQRRESVEKNAKALIEKLSQILSGSKNQSVAERRLQPFVKTDTEKGATGTATNDPANTSKAMNNDLVDNGHDNTEKWQLSMEDISKINNFTSELKRLIEESASGSLRRNPRYSYLSDPFLRSYIENDAAGMNAANNDGKEESTTVGNSPEFTTTLDFSTAEPKTQGSHPENDNTVLSSAQSTSLTASTDVTERSTENFTSETVNTSPSETAKTKIDNREEEEEGKGEEMAKGETYSTKNTLNLNTQEHQRKTADSDIVHDSDSDFQVVSVLSNDHGEKIIYASKTIEKETETDGLNPQNFAPYINFKRVKCMTFKFSNLLHRALLARKFLKLNDCQEKRILAYCHNLLLKTASE
ncbi:unnamed protein product [Litomosoides sigmodontis]|uniref:Uncharacterized protein n=1 Tax=Litomosoides sigmodontis TaxID=42156 RepID=A0A3P6TMS0_LITSI|nr:unnamed protein product [Litomosoides sigmodontis]